MMAKQLQHLIHLVSLDSRSGVFFRQEIKEKELLILLALPIAAAR